MTEPLKTTISTRAYGIATVPGGLVRTKEEAVALAKRVGFPVVMKMSVPDVTHKSDVGGVMLDIRDPQVVEMAFDKLMTPEAEGVNVQKMMGGAREVVIGVANDPSFGPILKYINGRIPLTQVRSWKAGALDMRGTT